MSNVFGIVNKPIFDSNVFKVGSPINIVDYNLEEEYNALIVSVSPMDLEVCWFNANENKVKFVMIGVDDFVNGTYDISGLVKMSLKESYDLMNSSAKIDEAISSVEDANPSNEELGDIQDLVLSGEEQDDDIKDLE